MAAVSAVTFVAYKHGSIYRRVFYPLLAGANVVFLFGSIIWNIGTSAAVRRVCDAKTSLEQVCSPDLLASVRPIQVGTAWFLVAFGTTLYLAFLVYFSHLVEDEKR